MKKNLKNDLTSKVCSLMVIEHMILLGKIDILMRIRMTTRRQCILMFKCPAEG